jgi:hypothetical protein
MTRPPVHKKISLSEGGNPFESKIGIRDGTSLRLDSLHDAEASFSLRVEILMTRLVMRKPVERCYAPVDIRIINLPSDINLSFKQPMIQFIYI